MRIVATISVLVLVACASPSLQSQDNSKPTRFEAGPQITSVVHGNNGSANNEFLFGGRFTFNVYRWLGIESEWGFTPQEVTIGGRANQFLFGPKVGIRHEKFGTFIKARGGFSSIGNVLKAVDVSTSSQTFGRQTNPVIDLGGVIEVYPAKRWILRYDFSDLVTQHNNNAIITFPPPLCTVAVCTFQAPDSVSHSFQFSTGISYRF